MGSASDLPVVEPAMKLLNSFAVPFEVLVLSAHRTPAAVDDYACGIAQRGVRVVLAAAGMAAALPGVVAARTTLPVVGIPIKGMLDGLDALLSMAQMPSGIPVATVGVNQSTNAALLAIEMLALSDSTLATKLHDYKAELAKKIERANDEINDGRYEWQTN